MNCKCDICGKVDEIAGYLYTISGMFICGECRKDWHPDYKDPRIKWKSIPPKVCPKCGEEIE